MNILIDSSKLPFKDKEFRLEVCRSDFSYFELITKKIYPDQISSCLNFIHI